MKLTELKPLIRIVTDIATKYGYQNALNQFRTAYAQILNLSKQPQTPQKQQQLNTYKLQAHNYKQTLLSSIDSIQKENQEILSSKIANQIKIDRFFGDTFLKLINEINESNVDSYINQLTQIYTQFNQLIQLNNALSFFELDEAKELEEDIDRLNIFFDGRMSIKTLKDLSRESALWNQHIHCFSRLARENDTDAIISSVEKGSLLLVITAAAGTVIAVMKAVDKILDTILKINEVRKNSVELKKLKLSYIDDAINLLDKHSKLNVTRDAEEIADALLIEFNWTDADELYNETKTATRTATKKILKFINGGGKVEGYVKNLTDSEPKKVIEDVKTKSERLKEIELQIIALSESKEILLLEVGDEEDNEPEESKE
jgi:hypothetical protein